VRRCVADRHTGDSFGQLDRICRFHRSLKPKFDLGRSVVFLAITRLFNNLDRVAQPLPNHEAAVDVQKRPTDAEIG
jgi:hypothetical protein